MAIGILQDGLGNNDVSGTATTRLLAGLGGGFTAGSLVLAAVVLQDTTKSVTPGTFADDTSGGSMVFTFVDALNITGARIELWATALNGGKAGGSFLRCDLSGATLGAIVYEEFSGVLALGPVSKANNTNANPTIAIVTQDANNYIFTGFGTVGGTVPTGGTGTTVRIKSSVGGSPVVATEVRNTVAAAGSVTTSITLAATTWGAVAIELRSVAGGGSALPAIARFHDWQRRARQRQQWLQRLRVR